MLDGSEVTLRPLSIRSLREFMKKLPDLAAVKDEDDTMDVLIALSQICLNKIAPDVASKDIEDILDIETIYKIIEVCGGVKLNDPNLVAAAEKVMGQANPLGQN